MGNPSYCGHSGSRFFASLTNPRPFLQNIGLLTVAVLLLLDLSALAQGIGNGNAWGTQGNSGQNNWLGTNDDTDLILKSFGQERLRLKADGEIQSQGLFKADRMKVLGLTELDSVRTVHIRANRITSQNPGDTLIFFGDSTVVLDHANNHIFVSDDTSPGESTTDKNMRMNCQLTPMPTPAGWKNHTIFNQYLGSVGIGTGSPLQKLHVQGNAAISGNIGVGTTSPQHRLDVRGPGTNYALRVQTDGTVIAGQLTGANSSGRLCVGDANHYIKGMFGKGLSLSTYGAVDALFIQEVTGKVAIGNITPPNNTSIYKLYVEGGITTRDVKVTAYAFPDYVFNDDYELPTIYQVADYIDKNGHLPGIPSEADVAANEGYELGDMQLMLLKKLEEQTLYIIKMQKQIDELNAKVNAN